MDHGTTDHSLLHQWLLAEPVQQNLNAADTGNAKGMYNGIKKATGQSATKKLPS